MLLLIITKENLKKVLNREGISIITKIYSILAGLPLVLLEGSL